MKKFATALVLLSIAAYAQAQDVTGQIIDGKIAVNGTFETAGLDFASSTGNLVPAADAAPFTFFLANTDKSIVYAAVPGTKVAIDGQLITGAGFNGSDATNTDQLSLSYGGVDESGAPVPVAFPVVPEPATGLMAAFGALGLLGFRRRR